MADGLRYIGRFRRHSKHCATTGVASRRVTLATIARHPAANTIPLRAASLPGDVCELSGHEGNL